MSDFTRRSGQIGAHLLTPSLRPHFTLDTMHCPTSVVPCMSDFACRPGRIGAHLLALSLRLHFTLAQRDSLDQPCVAAKSCGSRRLFFRFSCGGSDIFLSSALIDHRSDVLTIHPFADTTFVSPPFLDPCPLGGTITLVGGTTTLVRDTIILVRGTIALVEGTLTLDRDTIALVEGTITLIGGTATLV